MQSLDASKALILVIPTGNLVADVAPVAAADISRDGRADVILGSGSQQQAKVVILNSGRLLAGESAQSAISFSFRPYGEFTGGAWVAAGDINQDGHADVLTGAGAGGGPHVKLYDGRNLNAGNLATLRSFFPYPNSHSGCVRVAMNSAGEEGLGFAVSSGAGSVLPVIYYGTDYQETTRFSVYRQFGGARHVALGTTVNGAGDLLPFLVTGAGAGGGPHVLSFSAQ